MLLRLDLDAHIAGGAGDDSHGSFDIIGIQIGHLGLGDLPELRLGNLADLLLVGDTGTLGDADRLADEVGCRRSLGNEGEAAILIHRHNGRNRHITHRLRLRVELRTELLEIETVRTESGTDRGGGICLAGGDLELHESLNFFHRCHRIGRSSIRAKKCSVFLQEELPLCKPKLTHEELDKLLEKLMARLGVGEAVDPIAR